MSCFEFRRPEAGGRRFQSWWVNTGSRTCRPSTRHVADYTGSNQDGHGEQRRAVRLHLPLDGRRLAGDCRPRFDAGTQSDQPGDRRLGAGDTNENVITG